jgi:P27 family predicted phage terminase small subunit
LATRGPKPSDVSRSTPLPGIPDPPKQLDPAQALHWRELTELLDEAGLLSRLDRDVLVLYTSAWSRLKEAELALADEGVVITVRNGYRAHNPWVKVAKDCRREILAYLDRFGLTPAARERLTFPDETPGASKWDEFD